MTLARLLVAFALVTVVFLAAARLQGTLSGRVAWVTAAEAFVLTLLAALWFGSLGHGGWLLLFFLLGTLVAGAERGLRSAFLRSHARAELRGFAIGLARYVIAGAVLAWRLS